MPYEEIEVDLDCDVFTCVYHEDGSCTAEEDVEDLMPDNKKCFHYRYNDKLFPKTFINIKELSNYVEDHLDYEGPSLTFVPFDVNSCTLLYKQVDPVHKSLIQLNAEEESNYFYRPHIDGGIFLVDKNQMELELC